MTEKPSDKVIEYVETLILAGKLKVEDAKCMITTLFGGKKEKRYRVEMPDGKIRYMKEKEYRQHKEDQS